ncbi:hypothetical protein A3D54_02615 [Candidatus Falkowbacteria bacterium RIFCSPHIGHO2_02_FULL_45_15]|uniref:DUF559 domain-containing protein n=1 Tax=Candidatus Falkowbacteria bacterium RIFCSPHIGHO2_02_FULL_45_15 TaxID=1797987 RepID=A0A1F5RZH5_9BACT|nr:MAG: hypothetical protein A3D54_02615 [Candidatus Falkowbacteria bacterium RIFCSPHIGHO2_02_FULL_45_15]
MTLIYNKHKQKDKRKFLRSNSTLPEVLLWEKIKNKKLGARFRRQYGIGYYIADFCCPQRKVVIELDGGVHDKKEQRQYDGWRTEDIKDLGFTVIRFSNEEVKYKMDKVLEKVKSLLDV